MELSDEMQRTLVEAGIHTIVESTKCVKEKGVAVNIKEKNIIEHLAIYLLDNLCDKFPNEVDFKREYLDRHTGIISSITACLITMNFVAENGFRGPSDGVVH